jgi:hypothetical protein
MNLPNSQMLAAFGRHCVSYAMGAITFAAMTHAVSTGDASTLTNSVNLISQGVADIASGLGPILALATAAYSAWTASHASQIASVRAIPGVSGVLIDKSAAAPAVVAAATAPPKS